VYAAPLDATPILEVDENGIEAMLHGRYEQSAVVYSAEAGWYEIGLRGLLRRTGWIGPSDAGTFRSLEQLYLNSTTFVTAAWDKQLMRDAAVSPSEFVPSSADVFPSATQKKDGLSFMPADEPNGASVLETRTIDGLLWVKSELQQRNCDDSPEQIASGWLPAHSPSGHLNLWFFAGGC